MNRLFPSVCIAFVLLFTSCFTVWGQMKFSNKEPRPTYGGFYSIEGPVYRSKEDSLKLIATESTLNEVYQHNPVNQKKADSILFLRSKIMEEGILGFRNTYYPNPAFFPFDSLRYIRDKTTVTRLSIASRKLKRIPDEVLQCTQLEVLELVNCRLGKLQRELNGLKNLGKIQILNNTSRHKLKLSKNTIVKHIAIRGDHPRNLPRSYKKMEALTKIDLSENGITQFTNAARHNKKLIELDLQRNKITLNQNNIKPHPWLEQVGLQFNKIYYVPSSVKHFSNAKKIGFNHNLITDVAPEIGELKKLEHLSFYNNKLEAVPQGIYTILSLKVIDLFHNRIFKLEDQINNWQQLHTLYVSHNHLTTLPDVISKLPALQEIYAYDNSLKELPATLCDVKTLKVLRVNINEMKALPSCFDQLVNMEELDLSDNHITDLPSGIFSFPHLKILAIVDNPWNESLKNGLPAIVKKLRDQHVSVHLDSYGEEQD